MGQGRSKNKTIYSAFTQKEATHVKSVSFEGLKMDIMYLNKTCSEFSPKYRFLLNQYDVSSSSWKDCVKVAAERNDNESSDIWTEICEFSFINFYKLFFLTKKHQPITPTGPLALPEEPCETECPICLEKEIDVSLPCSHTFCHECIEKWASCQGSAESSCPLCRQMSAQSDVFTFLEQPSLFSVFEEFIHNFVGLSPRSPTGPSPSQ
eukprot:GCRY01004314.1.p1 GENE.GCRY01004314.1~~GCRY01004314.1.p1  ORF type:complete len:208 (+),score=31.90 GCRY01004314.1:147-770(+)